MQTYKYVSLLTIEPNMKYLKYLKITIAKIDRHKTSLFCHYGTFQYRSMPFGLITAPATFQRALDLTLTS